MIYTIQFQYLQDKKWYDDLFFKIFTNPKEAKQALMIAKKEHILNNNTKYRIIMRKLIEKEVFKLNKKGDLS